MTFTVIPGMIPGRSNEWVLLGPLKYTSALLRAELIVPEGFCTDLASIPRVAHPIIPVNGAHRLAAVVHDYLYYNRGKITINTQPVTLTRKRCDQIFLEAMGVLGVPWWQRTLMYNAVRVGGWAFWRSKKRIEQT